MPKKNLLIAGAVIVVLLIVAAVGFMLMSKSPRKSVDELGATKENVKDSSGVSATKESIRGLLSGGKNITCTVIYPDNGGGGTMYIADKKIRGDFSTKDTSGKQLESHMLQNGEFTYSWMGTQGVKMKIDTSVGASPAAGVGQQGADLDKQQDMNCSSWSVDDSKFIVPADVKFMDASGITQMPQTTIKPGASAAPVTNKSVCDAIADPVAKAACIGSGSSGGY